MTMLSPAATYHAELREHLGSVGRALWVQRALQWMARGLVVGTLPVLGLVIWSWTSDAVARLPIALLVALPVGGAVLGGLASGFVRQPTPELARRVDRAARLQERSATALELGARGEEFPLAIAQMRDAVEHLKRVDLFEAFPPRLPRTELLTALFTLSIAAIIAISPNPWVLRARASNPAITIAREQAERVQRVADSVQPTSPELDALHQLLSKGAKTVDARSNEPDSALNALQDLEDQVRQMSAGDDQLAAALAAMASALGGNPSTQQLADAINSGDMRQVAQATRAVAAASASMSSQDQQSLAKALRAAAQAAAGASQSVASNLSDAADALQSASESAAANPAAGDPSQANQTSQSGQPGSAASAQSAQAASNALNQLSNSAAAAGERERAASQIESSRNALERALGRTQSRSGTNNPSGSRSNTSSQNQSSNAGQDSQSQAGAGQGQPSDQTGDRGSGNGSGAPGDDRGNDGDPGQGGGYSTGGSPQNHTADAPSSLDAITSAQQEPGTGAAPDQSSVNPYLGEAGSGSARTQAESVAPSYSNQPTQGNDSGTIPLGMRDLVKDYFSSLDQK